MIWSTLRMSSGDSLTVTTTPSGAIRPFSVVRLRRITAASFTACRSPGYSSRRDGSVEIRASVMDRSLIGHRLQFGVDLLGDALAGQVGHVEEPAQGGVARPVRDQRLVHHFPLGCQMSRALTGN